MTSTEKRDILIGLNDYAPDIRDYITDLILEDILSQESYVTLQDAVNKYGNSMWYAPEIPMRAVGSVTVIDGYRPYKRGDHFSWPVFKYVFTPKWTFKKG